MLSTVWKKYIRKGLRSARLRDFYLAQDPVQFAAYEWGLTMFIARLSEELKGASYTPEPAVIVRGAKSTGLSRPLAVMAPRDALVYRTLVLRAEPDLKRDLRKWTGASMEDRDRLAHLAEHMKVEGVEPPMLDDEPTVAPPSSGAWVVVDDEGATDPPDDAVDATAAEDAKTIKKTFVLAETESYDDDWFQIWLSKQGIVANICDTCPFVVESDIANFFTATIRSFPLSPTTAQELVSTAVDVAELYRDVPLLASRRSALRRTPSAPVTTARSPTLRAAS